MRSTAAEKAERLNAAHSLLARGVGMPEAVVSLSRQFGLSRRQAYRYLQEAQAIGHAGAVGRAIGADHAKGAGEHRARCAGLFGDQRLDTQRDRDARDHGLSRGRTWAWLTHDHEGIGTKSGLITRLTVCSAPSFSRSTSSLFPGRSGSSASVPG